MAAWASRKRAPVEPLWLSLWLVAAAPTNVLAMTFTVGPASGVSLGPFEGVAPGKGDGPPVLLHSIGDVTGF